jgi:hypothetical protein
VGLKVTMKSTTGLIKVVFRNFVIQRQGWMYSQERELKKLRVTVRNKASVILRRHSRVK